MTPKERLKQRRTKPLRKIFKGLIPLAGSTPKGKKPTKPVADKFKNVLKNIKARRKAGATDSSSRLKLETAYDRARKLKPSGRLKVSDLRKVAKLSPAQRKKQLKRN